jgi:hypothetical protein
MREQHRREGQMCCMITWPNPAPDHPSAPSPPAASDRPHAVLAAHRHLGGDVLHLEARALAHGQHDRRDDRHQQQHGGKLERIHVLRVEHGPVRGVAVVRRQRTGAMLHVDVDAQASRATTTPTISSDHDATTMPAEPGSSGVKPSRRLLDVDVEHHHHEQEQHHHRAHVDQHQHDREELGLEQQPDRTRRCEERTAPGKAPRAPDCATVMTPMADASSSSAKNT